MVLSEIWIYPVKSLGGIRLKEAKVEERGLQFDRRWMIVDENGMFLTQRAQPRMALLDVSLEQHGLKITDRLYESGFVTIPYETVSGPEIKVTVWDDEVSAEVVSEEASNWLSRYLQLPVKLVKMPEACDRKADPKYAPNNEHVSFADGFPFLLISQESLDDLNTRLQVPVTMLRFRPNFVVAGATAYLEDELNKISISGIEFSLVKPCSRCVLTTIDPVTADKGSEPLKTLASYRRLNNKVLFGQNLVASKEGVVQEGDSVLVLH
ncbi:putative protein YcbX [Dyadobacter sp. CECT 9275]|uniref:MOSC domain-containing protein n=1 Tax=Dyadobacter helix TaxID=2822344 RepID=A0A916JFC7_9BACT|nr:MOSC N-terminal beta barrel domain-containing protein [Dyadobacter sp. CECT 9275]CAG5005877.1 putative protein YcbX [Dyadobacter sp. CECT 9275]